MRIMNTLILLCALLSQDKPFPDADPGPAIEAAKKNAAAENRRVLVLWGMNEHEGSVAAVNLLRKHKEVAKLIKYEYDVVFADMRRMPPGKPRIAIIPLLVILDAEGRELAGTAAPAEAREMIALLKKHQAPPLKAKDVLDRALKNAGEEKKRVLLAFGAPW